MQINLNLQSDRQELHHWALWGTNQQSWVQNTALLIAGSKGGLWTKHLQL